jgi:hypothetical protein
MRTKKLSLMLAVMFVAITSFAQDIKVLRPPDKDTVKVLDEVTIESFTPLPTDLVGEYKQPYWSEFRKSPNSRIYVQNAPGVVTFEHWQELRTYRNGTEMRTREELAFGLGHRFELDLYMLGLKTFDGNNGSFENRGISWEVRYALADWGKMWGNPTLYFEYQHLNNSYDVVEPKLLLGDAFGPKKNNLWSVNLVYEGNLAPYKDKTNEGQITYSYQHIFSRNFSLGFSGQYANAHERTNNYLDKSFDNLIGPSMQFRLNNKAYLDIEPMVGIGNSNKTSRTFVIFGWKFN